MCETYHLQVSELSAQVKRVDAALSIKHDTEAVSLVGLNRGNDKDRALGNGLKNWMIGEVEFNMIHRGGFSLEVKDY